MLYAFWTRRSLQSWVWIMLVSSVSIGLYLIQPLTVQATQIIYAEPEWVTHRAEEGGELRIEWKDSVTVQWKTGAHELSLSFSRPVGAVPMERLMREWEGYFRNLRYGYDNVLFEFDPSVVTSVTTLPKGVIVRIQRRVVESEQTAQIDTFESSVQKQQRVRLLREVARMEAGQPCRAASELAELKRELPRDENVLSEWVRAQWLCGAWSDALVTVEDALAVEATANSTRLETLRRGILHEHGEWLSADVGNRHVGDREHDETVVVRWRNRIGRHRFMNLELENRSIRSSNIVGIEGDETVFKGNRLTSGLTLEVTHGQWEITGGIRSNIQKVGAEAGAKYRLKNTAIGALAQYNAPYGDYVEGWIHYATRNSISSFVQGQPMNRLYGKLALGWNSYSVHGGGRSAESLLASATLAATLSEHDPIWVLRYTIDAENFDDIRFDVTDSNIPYTRLPVSDRKVNGLALEAQHEWAKQWRLQTTLGYAAGNQGEKGPFVFVNISYGSAGPWRVMLRGSQSKDWNSEQIRDVTEKGIRITVDDTT